MQLFEIIRLQLLPNFHYFEMSKAHSRTSAASYLRFTVAR
jgi:hypothetical protein